MSKQTAPDTETTTVADAVVVSVSAAGAQTDGGLRSVAPGVPTVGAFMTSDHRYYWNGEGPHPSVTGVLAVMDKPALLYYKAKESARAMLRLLQENRDYDLSLPNFAEDELVARAVRKSDESRDKAARLGTSVHLLADMASRGSESHSEGFEVGEGTQPYLKAFRDFLEAHRGSQVVSSEKMVWSANGYGGTYDLLMYLPDENGEQQLWLLDIKTSKRGDYPEYGLQLAAYRWADGIILPNDPKLYHMPEVHRTGVLHLRPELYKEGWKLIEYQTDYLKDYIVFLGLLEAWKWRDSKRFTTSMRAK
jgi:hypothetical protein